MSGDGDDFTITVARRKYPIFQIYIYLQHTRNFDGPKNLVISSIPVLSGSVVISAMLLQISRPLKPWDMQNIHAITS